MSKYKKLLHVICKCDYPIVWVPKYRLRILRGNIKELMDQDIRMLWVWKECNVSELNIHDNHIHLAVSVPPKVSISKLMRVYINYFMNVQLLLIIRKENLEVKIFLNP